MCNSGARGTSKTGQVILLSFLICAPCALKAAILLSDDFNYPDGPLTNAPGSPWVEHSGGGTNEELLVVSGQVQLTSSRTEDVDAPLAGQPFATNSGAV